MDAVLALTTRTAVAIEACQTVCDAAKAARHLIQYVVPRYASDLSVAANVLAFCANRATRRADVRCSLAILLCGYPVRWFLAWNSVSLIVFRLVYSHSGSCGMSGAFPLFAEIAATVAMMGVAVTGWTIWMWWQDRA